MRLTNQTNACFNWLARDCNLYCIGSNPFDGRVGSNIKSEDLSRVKIYYKICFVLRVWVCFIVVVVWGGFGAAIVRWTENNACNIIVSETDLKVRVL